MKEIVAESIKQTIIQINKEQLKAALAECIQKAISEVHFYFTEVRLLTKTDVVIQGDSIISRSDIPIGKRKPKIIQIDYKFNEQQFYEAVYCANNTLRDIRALMLDYAGIDGLTFYSQPFIIGLLWKTCINSLNNYLQF